MKKKLLCALVAVCMMLALTPTVYAAEDFGSCGENVTWEYDDGVLTIEGSGYMEDYTTYSYPPYSGLEIYTVMIGENVTSIGDRAFYKIFELTDITIPDSVAYIGEFAFRNCENLTSIIIPSRVVRINRDTFAGCENLVSVTLSKNISRIEESAFSNCDRLIDVYYEGSESDWENIEIDYSYGNDRLKDAIIHYNSAVYGQGSVPETPSVPDAADRPSEPSNSVANSPAPGPGATAASPVPLVLGGAAGGSAITAALILLALKLKKK